jgi:hypothetical protein
MASTPNRRRVRVLDDRPVDFLDADRAQMLTLPPVAPTVETVTSVRSGRDYYVRQIAEVSTTLTQVRVSRAGRVLARTCSSDWSPATTEHHADVLTLKGSSYRLKDTGIDTLPSARADNTAQ